MSRALVENVDRLTKDLIGLDRQQVFEPLSVLTEAGLT